MRAGLVIYDILLKKFTHFSFQPPFLLFQKLLVSSTPTGPCIWQHLLKCQYKTHLPLSKNLQETIYKKFQWIHFAKPRSPPLHLTHSPLCAGALFCSQRQSNVTLLHLNVKIISQATSAPDWKRVAFILGTASSAIMQCSWGKKGFDQTVT